MASKMLLLPDPFGPEIETNPGSKFTVVFLKPNDLNPKISTFVMWTNIYMIADTELSNTNKFS